MNEPMDERRLAEIRELDSAYQTDRLGYYGAVVKDRRDLLREVDRLRAELAAAQANPVLRFLMHRNAVCIERVGKSFRVIFEHPHGRSSGIRDTPEAACEAALKAMEASDGKT